jgi:hypothetical protein
MVILLVANRYCSFKCRSQSFWSDFIDFGANIIHRLFTVIDNILFQEIQSSCRISFWYEVEKIRYPQ